MMMYPLLAAKAAQMVDETYITTDSVRMQEIAAENNVGVINRPAELATATSQHVDTLIHAIGEIRMRGTEIDKLIVLMCNCATYPRGIIDKCLLRLEADPLSDSCVTGYVENDHHPYRVKKMGPDGYLSTWMDLSSIPVSTNRQDLPPCYILDHAMWILKVDRCFPPRGQKPWTFMGNNILFEDNPGSCDIHSIEDIGYTEKYLLENGWKSA
jgi:CMP-N-acetylneuraminic acid synthetase